MNMGRTAKNIDLEKSRQELGMRSWKRSKKDSVQSYDQKLNIYRTNLGTNLVKLEVTFCWPIFP